MAYTIDRYSGVTLTTVEDGTVDQTTDIKLVGKNYAGYGEIQNENFLHLLENFSGTSQPPKAISGQIWFDATASKLKFYDGSRFRTTGGAEVSATQPAGLASGDLWWDSTNQQLYAYSGSGFVLIGPQGSGTTVTQMKSVTIRDVTNTNRLGNGTLQRRQSRLHRPHHIPQRLVFSSNCAPRRRREVGGHAVVAQQTTQC